MSRLNLFEFEDLPRFPAMIRDLVTDYLRVVVSIGQFYRPVTGVLARALRESGSRNLVDLCSGGGGPILPVLNDLKNRHSLDVSCTLTDRYPHLSTFRRLRDENGAKIQFEERAVDARKVPAGLTGFRTFFNAFHHFPPEEAHRILADARKNAPGIAVFELTERNWVKFLLILISPLWAVIVTPFIRPFSFNRLFFTYLIPAVPFVAVWDGLVSVFRSYKVAELESMADSLKSENFCWEVGKKRNFLGISVVYLVGYSRRAMPPKN